jgi:hypothetical protein
LHKLSSGCKCEKISCWLISSEKFWSIFVKGGDSKSELLTVSGLEGVTTSVTTFVRVAGVESLVLLVVQGLEGVTTFVIPVFGMVTRIKILISFTEYRFKTVTTYYLSFTAIPKDGF